MKKKSLLFMSLISVGLIFPISSAMSKSKEPLPIGSFELFQKAYIGDAKGLLFNLTVDHVTSLGYGRNGLRLVEKLWVAKKEELLVSVKYSALPGRPSKKNRTLDFLAEVNLNANSAFVKERAANAISSEVVQEKITNGMVTGYIATLEAKPNSKFAVVLLDGTKGEYSCLTEARLSKFYTSYGVISHQMAEFHIVAASNDCGSPNHQNAVAPIKSISG